MLGRVAARLHDTTAAENAFREVAQSPDCPVFLKWEAERSLARLYEDEKQFDSAEERVSNRAHDLRNRALGTSARRFPAAVSHQRFPHLRRLHSLTRISRQDGRGLAGCRLQPRSNSVSKGSDCCPKEALSPPSRSMPSKLPATPVAQSFSTGSAKRSPTCGRSRRRRSACFNCLRQRKSKPESSATEKRIIDQRESSPTANDDGTALYRILVEPAKALLPKRRRKYSSFPTAA